MALQRPITLATELDGASIIRAETDRRDQVPQPAALSDPQAGGERRNHLEVQLTGIWLEMLKLPRIGSQEDFFDLGGDSLLATEMFHRVEQDFGCSVDPSRVLTGLTIERMAAEIMEGSRETFANPVVQVQSGGSRTPFFFLHHDYSGGFYCRRIARALGPDITLYAVHPHGLNGTAFRDSIEDMAAERVRSIMQVQPSGPLRIGGFCHGGVVAYEVARQLIVHGRRVETLLLIDTVAPSLVFRSAWAALLRRGAAVVRLSPATQREIFLRLKWYAEELKVSGRTGLTGWIALLWRKLICVATRARSGAPEAAAAPDPGTGDARRALGLQFRQRASAYVPGDYRGPRVVLFRSTYLDSPHATGTVGRWRMLTSGLEVHPIPGDHFTCVTTHAADLAAAMRPYLQD
jgi:thioesterase domain-containing protein/acyl carrier protein